MCAEIGAKGGGGFGSLVMHCGVWLQSDRELDLADLQGCSAGGGGLAQVGRGGHGVGSGSNCVVDSGEERQKGTMLEITFSVELADLVVRMDEPMHGIEDRLGEVDLQKERLGEDMAVLLVELGNTLIG